MSNTRILGALIGLALAALLALGGCSALSSIVAGELTKGAAGSSQAPAQPQPAAPASSGMAVGTPAWNQAMTMQAHMAFNYTFSGGGLWVGQVGYKPGEYTKFRWEAKGEDPMTMERAFLKKLDDGKEWWRVSWANKDDSWVWEALLDPQTGSALRLRGRDPDGQVGEIPVTGETFYTPQAQVTKESVQAATVGTEKVQVPAGSFTAQHVVYSNAGAGGKAEFWTVDTVPGGVVKYMFNDAQGGKTWTSSLVEQGKNATTILGAY